MSAVTPKADKGVRGRIVRFVPEADIPPFARSPHQPGASSFGTHSGDGWHLCALAVSSHVNIGV
jgi:hypothetical protein